MNQLRDSFGFEGTPIRLLVRRRGGDEKGEKRRGARSG
jgi:predicted GTPase